MAHVSMAVAVNSIQIDGIVFFSDGGDPQSHVPDTRRDCGENASLRS